MIKLNEEINSLISNLKWDYSTEVQQEAIEKLIQIDEKYISLLIQPIDKNHWENAALVLKKIGYPRNKIAIPGLLEWLKDLNWPGAWTVLETLQSIDIEVLLPHIKNAINEATEENDEMWLMAIKELVINRLGVTKPEFKEDGLYNKLR